MKTFGGPALFLDRSDINTDEIIPAKYLTEITKEDLKPYILEDLKLQFVDFIGSIFKTPIQINITFSDSGACIGELDLELPFGIINVTAINEVARY